jgi:hypothetical protein
VCTRARRPESHFFCLKSFSPKQICSFVSLSLTLCISLMLPLSLSLSLSLCSCPLERP